MRGKLQVDPDIYVSHPDYVALVIYAEGMTNGPSDGYSVEALRAAEASARALGRNAALDGHAHIQAWRQAFKSFGAKPKRYFCGAESLLRRVLEGDSIPQVNRIVDAYNAVSMKYVLPVGGEDWERLVGDLRLVRARGDEPFVTAGAEGEQTAYPSPGEIIWADLEGATVRRWNWRQCRRTRITDETQSAYFVLDRLAPYPVDELTAAGEELISHLKSMSPDASLRSELLHAADAVLAPAALEGTHEAQ
ncbi:MAG: B3/4 domain-containing protein [Pyrinomonadaceae bacterium]